MKRIVVVGSSGSGKTTLARELAARLGLAHTELDGIAHRRGFETTPRPEFVAEVSKVASGEEWVVDGMFASWGTREILWPRADTFVWLDMPRHVVMRRVMKRTLKRLVTGEVLWEGARERWGNLVDPNPESNIVLWTWARYHSTRAKLAAAIRDRSLSHAEIHHLRSEGDLRHFLTSLDN